MDGREAIAQYKEWYYEFYGVKPTEKLIEIFCKIKGIDIEKIREQAREEVAKVEESKEYEICSALKDVPTKSTDSTAHMAIQYTEENFRALETNYNNLLSDYEEICNISQEQAKIIERYQKAEIEALGGADG